MIKKGVFSLLVWGCVGIKQLSIASLPCRWDLLWSLIWDLGQDVLSASPGS